MLMRLSIPTEDLDKKLVDHIIESLEKNIPNLAVRNRDDYQVIALIGNMNEIKQAIDIILPMLPSEKT